MSDNVDLTLTVSGNSTQAVEALRQLAASEDAVTAATGRTKAASEALAKAQALAAESIGLTTAAGHTGAEAATEYSKAVTAATAAGIPAAAAATVMAESIGLTTAAGHTGAAAATELAEATRLVAAAMVAEIDAAKAAAIALKEAAAAQKQFEAAWKEAVLSEKEAAAERAQFAHDLSVALAAEEAERVAAVRAAVAAVALAAKQAAAEQIAATRLVNAAYREAAAEQVAAARATAAALREEQAEMRAMLGPLSTVSKNLFSLGGIALIAAGGLAYCVKQASDFDAALINLQARTGMAAEGINQVREQALAMAGDPLIAKGPAELVKGVQEIENTLGPGAKSLEAWKQAAMGAHAAQDDLVSTAKALAVVMHSGIAGVDSEAHAMDGLVRIATTTGYRMDGLGRSMADVLNLASRMGGTFQEVGGAYIAMGKAEETEAKAKQTLLNLYRLMENPSKQQIAALGEYADALVGPNRKTLDLVQFVQALTLAVGDNKQAWEALNPGVGRSAGIFALAQENGTHLTEGMDSMKQSVQGLGDTMEKSQAQAKGLTDGWALFKAELQSVAAEIGEGTIPMLDKLARYGAAALKWMQNPGGLSPQLLADLKEFHKQFEDGKTWGETKQRETFDQFEARKQKQRDDDAQMNRLFQRPEGVGAGPYLDKHGNPVPVLPAIDEFRDAQGNPTLERHETAADKKLESKYAEDAAKRDAAKNETTAALRALEEKHQKEIHNLNVDRNKVLADQASGKDVVGAPKVLAAMHQDELRIESDYQRDLHDIRQKAEARDQAHADAAKRRQEANLKSTAAHHAAELRQEQERQTAIAEIRKLGAAAGVGSLEARNPEEARDRAIAAANRSYADANTRLQDEFRKATAGNVGNHTLASAAQEQDIALGKEREERDRKIADAQAKYKEQQAAAIEKIQSEEQRQADEIAKKQASDDAARLKAIHDQSGALERLYAAQDANERARGRGDLEDAREKGPQQAASVLRAQLAEVRKKIANTTARGEADQPEENRVAVEQELLVLLNEERQLRRELVSTENQATEAAEKSLGFARALMEAYTKALEKQQKVMAELRAKLDELKGKTKPQSQSEAMKDEEARKMGFTGINDPNMPADVRKQITALVDQIQSEMERQKNRLDSVWREVGNDAVKDFSEAGKQAMDQFFESMLSSGRKHGNIAKQIANDFREAFIHSLGNVAQRGISSLAKTAVSHFFPQAQHSDSGSQAAAAQATQNIKGLGDASTQAAAAVRAFSQQLQGGGPPPASQAGGGSDAAAAAAAAAAAGMPSSGGQQGALTSLLPSLFGKDGKEAGSWISDLASFVPFFDFPSQDSVARRSGYDYGTVFHQGMRSGLAADSGHHGGGDAITVNAEAHHHYHGGAPSSVDLNRTHEDLFATVRRAFRTR